MSSAREIGREPASLVEAGSSSKNSRKIVATKKKPCDGSKDDNDDSDTSDSDANYNYADPITSNQPNSNNSAEQEDDDECWADVNEELPSSMTNHSQKYKSGQLNNDKSTQLVIKSNNESSFKNSSCVTNTTDNDDEDSDLELHKAVFRNDVNKLKQILECPQRAKQIVNKKDKHGNTSLHLACMLGRSKDLIESLLDAGATLDSKNLNRWTAYHEACSYGDREVIKLLTKKLKHDMSIALTESYKNKLAENLNKTKNYRLVLKWEFQTWIPFLNRVLPSDVCVITKHGKYIRIDTKLLDVEIFSKCKMGDACLIFSDKLDTKWVLVSNTAKKYCPFFDQPIGGNIEDEVDRFMSSDILDIELKSSEIQLSRSTCGWIWRSSRVEKVGRYNADIYNFNNVYLLTRKRREHLDANDMKRNKLAYRAAVHVLKFGQKPPISDIDNGSSSSKDEGDGAETEADELVESLDGCSIDQVDDGSAKDGKTTHRESLPPPPPTNVKWEEYYSAEAGKYPTLGREQKCKVVKTPFSASVAMSEDFPITKNEFLDLISIIPLKHFKKMKEFIELRLPNGFPVRLDVPVFPFLSARITFEDFTFLEGSIDESLFDIPQDYVEDPNLMKNLFGRKKPTTKNEATKSS